MNHHVTTILPKKTKLIRRLEYLEDGQNSSETDEIKQNFGYRLDRFTKDHSKLLKIYWTQHPLNPLLYIGDIQFIDHNREYSTYLSHPEIHQRVRLGCSLLKV